MNIQLKIHHKQGSTHLINIPLKQKLAVIVAQPKGDVTFELIDLDTQLAPQPVFMKRVGNDLHIFIDDNTLVDVVITDYYTNEPLSPIMGMAEDGLLYPYLAESNLLADSIPHLSENVLAAQVLGGEGVVAAFLPFNWKPLLVGLAGLAGIGLVKALTDRGTDDSTDTPPVADDSEEETSAPSTDNNSNISFPPPSQPTLGLSQTLDANGNKTGGITIPNNPQFNRFEVEFTPEGKNKPVKIVYERQPDGSLKLVTDLDKFGLSHLTEDKLPPATVPAGQDIQLPPDLLKDNSPVSVKGFTNSGESTETITAPYDQNTQIELDPVKGFDRDNDGKLDAAEISGTTSPGATVVIRDKDGNKIAETTADDKGNFTVPVALDPKNLNSDGLEDLTITATKPGENSAQTKIPEDKYPNVADLDTPNNSVVEVPKVTPVNNDTPSDPTQRKPLVLNVEVPNKEKVTEVELKVIKPSGEEISIPIQKNEQGQFVLPENSQPITKLEETENGFQITLEGVDPQTKVVAIAKNQKGDQSEPSTPIIVGENGEVKETDPETLEASKKPTITKSSLKAIDESVNADDNPEVLKLSGSGAGENATVTLYLQKDGKNIPLATVRADAQGNFNISATDLGKGVDMLTGDTIYVTATEAGKKPTASETEAVPEVPRGRDGHPYDSVKPVDPEVITKQSAGDGSAKVVANQIKPFEVLTVNFKDEGVEGVNNGEPVEHSLKFQLNAQGNLEQIVDPANQTPEHIKFTIVGKTITFDENSLLDNNNVDAQIEDLADLASEVVSKPTGFDDVSNRVFDVVAKPKDTDKPVADHLPEVINTVISGSGDTAPQVGDKVKITDDLGNVLFEGTLEEKHKDPNQAGNFIVPAKVYDDNKPPKTISVTLQEEGKDPTDPVIKPVGEVPAGKEGHEDDVPPTPPTIAQTEDATTIHFNPENTDKLTVRVNDKPVVNYTKDPATGVFKSDNPAFPDLPAGSNSVDIPRTQLPAEGTIQVVAEDIAGNRSDSGVPVDLLPLPESQLDPVRVTKVISTDTDEEGDLEANRHTIEGEGKPGATVLAKVNGEINGEIIGRATVDDKGKFVLITDDLPNGKVPNASQIELIQDKDNYLPSDPVNPANADKLEHLDNTPPAAPVSVNSGKNDVTFAVSKDTKELDVTYTDKNGNPQSTTLVRENGVLKSTDPNVVVREEKDPEGRDLVSISAEVTKPNTDVSATAKDIPGNKSSTTKVPTVNNNVPVVDENPTANTDREPTNAPILLTIQAKDSSSPSDGKADQLVVSGTAEPNAMVEIKQGNTLLGRVRADKDGNFTVTVSKPLNTPENERTFNQGEEISATAKADDKDPSRPSNKLVPAVSLFDDQVSPENATLTLLDNGDMQINLPDNNSITNPAKKIVAGDQIVVSIQPKDPNQPPVTVVLTKRKDEGWDSDNPDIIPSTNNNTTQIADQHTPSEANVSVVSRDVVGNESRPNTENAGKDHSGKPEISRITSIDTSNPFDENPEEFLIEGTAPKGAFVVAKDTEGNVLGTGTADPVTGKFSIKGKEGAKDLMPKTATSGDQIYVEAIENKGEATEKAPTKSEPMDIPAVLEGAEHHTGDRTPPAPVDIELDNAGNGTIPLPKNPQKGDKVKGEIVDADGNSTPFEVEFDGENWVNPNSPNVELKDTDNDGKPDTAVIPKGDLPAGGSVNVHTEDGVGNPSVSDSIKIPLVSATPTITSVTALDNSQKADNDPELLLVKGTLQKTDGSAAEVEGTVIYIKDSNGKVIGSGKLKSDGTFEVLVKEPTGENSTSATENFQISQGERVKASAVAPGKSESTDSALSDPIAAVERGKAGHIGDRENPEAMQLVQDSPENQANQPSTKQVNAGTTAIFKLPDDADQVIFNVLKKDSAPDALPQEVILTKNAQGGFDSSDTDLIDNIPASNNGTMPQVSIDTSKLKENSVMTGTVKDLADNVSQPLNVLVAKPQSSDDLLAAHKVQAPTLTTEADNTVKLVLPTGDEATDTRKVVFSYQPESPENAARVEIEVTRTDSNGTWTISKQPQGSNLTVGTNNEIILPEKLVKDGSLVTAYSTNDNGSVVSKTVTTDAAIVNTTATPSVKVTPVDTSDNADETADKVRFEGEVQGEPNALVEIKDGSGNVIATTRTDENGKYSVEVDAGKTLGSGDNPTTVGDLVNGTEDNNSIKVTATSEGKKPSNPATEVSKAKLEHTDKQPPEAVQFEVDNAGNVTAIFPENSVEGDVVTLEVLPKGSTNESDKKIISFKKKGENWELQGTAPEGFDNAVQNNKFVIPAAKLAKNDDLVAQVKAIVTDVAKNSRESEQEIIFTHQPIIKGLDNIEGIEGVTSTTAGKGIKAIDSSYYSDSNPEKLVITGELKKANGTPAEAVGTLLIAKDPANNVIGTGYLKADGTFVIEAQESYNPTAEEGKRGHDIVKGSEIRVEAVATGKVVSQPSEKVAVDVDDIYHEETVPPTLTITPKADDPNTAVVKTDPDAKIATVQVEGSDPVTVTFNEDGSITSSNPEIVPNVPVPTQPLPADHKPTFEINTGGKPVSVTVSDLKDQTTVGEYTPSITLEQTPPATDLAVSAIDLSKKADDNPEKFIVTGNTVPNAYVEIMDPTGKVVIGEGYADAQGRFEITALDPDQVGGQAGDINVGDKLQVFVTDVANNKSRSEKAEVTVIAVPEGKAGHEGDIDPPSVVSITRGEEPTQGGGQGDQDGDQGQDGENPADDKPKAKPPVIVKLDDDVDSATVCVGDQCTTVKRDEDGNFVSDNPELVKPKGDNTLEIPADVAEGKEVSVTPVDKAGNEGETAVLPAIFVPKNPTLKTADADVDPDGSVVLEFPQDARVGDKVVFSYKENQAEGEPVRKQIIFTKTEDGWTKAAGEPAPSDLDSLPNVDKDPNTGIFSFKLPADKVEDESTVNAYSENRENTGRREPVEAQTGIDGDGATTTDGQPSVPQTNIPVITTLVAEDLDGDGNPDRFTLTGTVEAQGETEVTIQIPGREPFTVAVVDGQFTANFADKPNSDIQVGTEITLTAKEQGKTTSQPPVTKTVKDTDVVNRDTTPPDIRAELQNDGVKVTLDPNPKAGDTAEITVTPKEGEPKTHKYKVEDGKWVPEDPTSPPVVNGNEVDVIAAPESKVEGSTQDKAGNRNSTGIVTVPPRAEDDNTPAPPVVIETTKTPTDLKLTKVIDSNNPADGKFDRFVIRGKVPGEEAGVDVFIRDDKGNLFTGKTQASGVFEIEFSEAANRDLEPNREPADNLKVSAKAANKYQSAEENLALSNEQDLTKGFADQLPPQEPTVTGNSLDGSVKVKLPDDAQVGEELVIEYVPTGADDSNEPKKTIKLIKQPDGSWAYPENTPDSEKPFLAPIDGQESVTLPEGLLKDGSDVTATITDHAGNRASSTGQAGKDRTTVAPTEIEITPMDLNSPADSQIEKVKIAGKVKGEKAGTKVFVYDSNNNLLGETTTTDDQGNFELYLVENNAEIAESDKQNAITVSENIEAGSQYRFKAQAADKKISDDFAIASVPAIPSMKTENGEEVPLTKEELAKYHPNDTTNPTPPTVLTGQPHKPKGDGSATIGFPKDAVAGDKVQVTYKPEPTPENLTPEDKTVTFTKGEDGNWTSDDPTLQPKGNSVTIPEDRLADGEVITAVSIDVAGNQSSPASTGTSGKDEVATAPTEVKITPISTNLDLDPEKVKITGKGKPGETIKVLDKDGEEVASFDIPANDADPDTLVAFEIEVSEPKPINLEKDTPLTLKAVHKDKEESDTATYLVPEMRAADPQTNFDGTANNEATGGDQFTTDSADKPVKPTLTPNPEKGNGSMTLEVPNDPQKPTQAGDRLQVQFFPENAKQGDQPTVATLTKQADGSWTSDNPLIPSIPADKESVEIPENSLLDGEPVKARVVNVAGVSSEVDTKTAGFDAMTTTPYDLVLTPFDSDNPANTSVDAVLMQGKTDAGAVLSIVKADTPEQPITPENPTEDSVLKADDNGNFKVLVVNADAQNVEELKAKLKEKGLIDDNTKVITLPAGSNVASRDNIHFSAQADKKDPSDKAESEVGNIANNELGHLLDNQPLTTPSVTPVLADDQATGDKRGAVKVGFPTENVQEGDQLALTFTKQKPADGSAADEVEVTIVYTYDDGKWQAIGEEINKANNAGIPVEATNNSLTIPADKVKDGSKVTAKTTDLAGNSSEASGNAPYEQITKLDSVKVQSHNIVAENTQADPKDIDPEKIVVSGTSEKGATVTVKLKDKTDPTKVVELSVEVTNEDGSFEVTFEEGKAPLFGDKDHKIDVDDSVEITAQVVGVKAANQETKPVPPTRTVFVEVEEVDTVDLGSPNGNSLNANISDTQIDKVTVKGWVEEEADPANSQNFLTKAKLTVKVFEANGTTLVATKVVEANQLNLTDHKEKDAEGAKQNSNAQAVRAGKFSVELTKDDLVSGKTFAAGQKVVVTAENTGTEAKGDGVVDKKADGNTALTLPALVDGTTDHPEDKQATELTNDAITFSNSSTDAAADGRTHASITLPTEADVKKITVTFNGEDGAEKKAVFTRKTGGGWAVSTKNGENTAGLSDITGNTLTIAHDKLNGGTDTNQRGSISVKVEDIAGQSKTLTQAVPEDKTTALSVTSTTGADTSPRADKVAETVTITGTATDGATVTLVDANGKPIVKTGGGNITATATGGNFSLSYNVADIPADKRAGLKLVAKADGHQTSAQTSFTVPEATSHSEQNKPAVTAAVENSTSAVRFTMNEVQDSDSDSDKLPKLADGDVLKVFKGNDETNAIAEFKYDNGAWTPVTSHANVDAPVAIKDGTGKTTGWYVDVRADNNDFPQGTTIKAKLTDIAGNFGEANGNLPNPDHIDIPEVFVGSRTKSHPNDDVKDADRLEIPANNEVEIKPNAGDIWIKPGADNTLLTIKLIKSEATTDPQTGEAPFTTIYGVKKADGSWALAEDQAGNTPVTYGRVKNVDGTSHLQIDADAVRDKSPVSVVATDGVNSTDAMKVDGQAKPVDNTKSVVADFDDTTESVTVSSAVQTDGDITITPTANDAIIHITEFQTSSHFGEEVGQSYDLAPTTGRNYLVAYKLPKTEAAGNEWRLGFIAMDKEQFTDPKVFEQFAAAVYKLPQPHPDVATIDPQTGKVTLKAMMVQNGSKVKVGYLDAYGESGKTGDAGQPDNLTVTNDARTTPVLVDEPDVTSLGNGLVQVTAGQVDIKKHDTDPAQDTLDGSNFKTLIDLTGDLDKDAASGAEITIVYDDATKAYKLDNGHTVGSTVGNVTITAFDPRSGTVTLKSTQDGAPVKAVAYKTPEGQTQPKPSAVVESSFSVADPFAEEADQPTVKADLYGAVEITPGADNKKVEVSYTDENGSPQKATLTLNGDTWTSSKPNDFEITSGKIKLKNFAVKDGTEVSAVGFDGNTYPADYPDTALQNQPVKSEPHSDYALLNDNSQDTIENIVSVEKDTQDGANDKDVLITRGPDHTRVDITFTPVGKDVNNPADKVTIVAELQKGGEWSLTYKDGANAGKPVPENVAVIRGHGNVELKRPAIADTTEQNNPSKTSKVSAKGYDNEGFTSAEKSYDIPYEATVVDNVRDDNLKIKVIDDGKFEGWYNGTDTGSQAVSLQFWAYDVLNKRVERYMLLKKADGTEEVSIFYPADQNGGTHSKTTLLGVTFADFGATYSNDGENEGKHKISVDSSKAGNYLVLTDSPEENQATGNKLDIWYTSNKYADDKAVGRLVNDHKYDPNRPFSVAPKVHSVVAIDDQGDNQGGAIITPHKEHSRLIVKYVRETGGKATAVLLKKGNKWEYQGDDYPNDFILGDDGSIRMHHDALRDNTEKGLAVLGGAPGKIYSDPYEVNTTEDKAPIPPANSGLRENLEDALNSAEKISNDITYRNRSGGTAAFNELKDLVEKKGGKVTVDTNERKVTITFPENDGSDVLVNGSIGDTAAAGWGVLAAAFMGRQYDIEVNMGNGNNILALKNDLGDNDTNGLEMKVNMGRGNDVLTIGGALKDFVLVENKNTTNPGERYRFEKNDGTIFVAGQGNEKVEELESADISGNLFGGRMHHSRVNMGDGNDLVMVEGFRSGDPAAIFASTVNLGEGNDVLLIAPNAEDKKAISDRGSILNSVVNAGGGNDYIKAVGADEGANIYLGEGNDTLVLTRVEKNSTLIDAGSGDDVVNVTGEVRGGAKINLGSGDDTFIFGGSQNVLFGASGTHALFEGELDGGSGYDIVKLHTPFRTSLIQQQKTNLHSENFKNIEEIWLQAETSVDLRYADLLADGVNGPIKIRGFSLTEDGKTASITGKAVVDLGANDLNGVTEGKRISDTQGSEDSSRSNQPNQKWKKVGQETEFGITYDVYHFDGDSYNAVWVEQNQNIFVI